MAANQRSRKRLLLGALWLLDQSEGEEGTAPSSATNAEAMTKEQNFERVVAENFTMKLFGEER
jgi:hypothetical protein